MCELPFTPCCFVIASNKEMLIGNGIDNWMVDTVKLAAILPITSSMVRTADDERRAALFFPAQKQASQFPVHIAKGRGVAFQGVVGSSF